MPTPADSHDQARDDGRPDPDTGARPAPLTTATDAERRARASLTVAAVQMVSGCDMRRNLDDALQLIAQAAAAGAQLVALPEYFCLLGQRDEDKLVIAEPQAGTPTDAASDAASAATHAATHAAAHAAHAWPMQDALAAAARQHRIWLVAGTLPLHSDTPQRVRNSVLVYNPQGQLAARYDKLHLFAYDNGRERYDEARVLQAGDAPVAFDLHSQDGQRWRVGLSVCYDLRFPELYRALMQPQPCDLLLVPAAFTHSTGQAHWELLLRARAVENQCYVLAPAQGGLHANGRRTWGHSLLADPWGELLACRPQGPGLVLGTLQRARIDQVRQQLPALAHRRL